MYDLENDPLEMQNLYGQEEQEGLIIDLKQQLADLQTTYKVPEDVIPPK